MMWLLTGALGLLLVSWLRWRHQNRRLLAISKTIPGPPAIPMLGNALHFLCQPEEFPNVIRDLKNKYGDVLRFWLGTDLNVVVSNPDDLKVLLSSTKTTTKGPLYKYMADILGGGILSGSGPQWRKDRKIANPNYAKRAVDSYDEAFNDEIDLLLQKFRKLTGNEFNIYDNIVQTTSYMLCRTLMGLTKEQTMSLPNLHFVIEESPKLYDTVFNRMTKWYFQIDPFFWLTNEYRFQVDFVKKMNELCSAILGLRMRYLNTLEDQNKTDLMNSEEDSLKNTQLSVIDRFLLSQELNIDDLIKETLTVFTSGQEASAKMCSYVLLMMAYHPQCQDKLYAEIKSVLGDEDRPVTNGDLKRMPYLDMVFKEVLRLFPIGALIQRTVMDDINISAGTLPAGCSLVIPIYHLHRDPRFWRNPEAFDPERFSPENVRSRHPHCYIPFSLGPMDCLGRHYGTKLIKSICVRVLREFQVTSVKTYDDLKLSISISVVALEGYYVKLTPRTQME